jgi:hypothetical protein
LTVLKREFQHVVSLAVDAVPTRTEYGGFPWQQPTGFFITMGDGELY